MLSYVLNAASSYVRYTPLGPHFGPAPSAQAPTDLSKVNNPREASESSLFDTPSSASTSPSSSRESSTWDSSSDSSDASTSSSSSRQSSSSSASSSRASQQQHNPEPEHESESNRYAIIEDVLRHENLYDVLGVTKSADLQALRRAYITRSKRCHPDKFPENPLSTLAFQKVSFAYDTLSDASTRRTYDRALASARHTARRAAAPQQYHPSPDDTLNAVLYGVFCDFMDGDYEIIRTLLRAVGEINQRMAMGDDTIESLLQSLMRLREVLLVGRKYIRIIRFELIRMYEIQHNLRQLSYFDVRGRLRLTLQLARVGLSLPVVVDTAMRSEDDDTDGSSDSEREEERPSRRRRERSSRASDRRPRSRVRLEKVQGRRRRGLLPPPVSVVIGLAIGALEIGESVL